MDNKTYFTVIVGNIITMCQSAFQHITNIWDNIWEFSSRSKWVTCGEREPVTLSPCKISSPATRAPLYVALCISTGPVKKSYAAHLVVQDLPCSECFLVGIKAKLKALSALTLWSPFTPSSRDLLVSYFPLLILPSPH
jgi:hypothetical protein